MKVSLAQEIELSKMIWEFFQSVENRIVPYITKPATKFTTKDPYPYDQWEKDAAQKVIQAMNIRPVKIIQNPTHFVEICLGWQDFCVQICKISKIEMDMKRKDMIDVYPEDPENFISDKPADCLWIKGEPNEIGTYEPITGGLSSIVIFYIQEEIKHA